MKTSKQSFKSGAAAIYIVIFTTILLSVIAVSFIRVMTSDVGNTVNDDLSASAYDSALAGVEDAKIALVKYHNCIDQGKKGSSTAEITTCEGLIYHMQEGIKNSSCDTVSTSLGRTSADNPEPVVIQETSSDVNAPDSSKMSQAYTCVKITEELTDYRGTLDSENRTTIIPLRTNDDEYGQVRALKIMWYSSEYTNTGTIGSTLPPRSSGKIPSLTADIFQTNANSFTIGSLSTRQGNQIDFASLFLRASSYNGTDSTNPKYIAKSDVVGIADKYDNSPFDVSCTNAAFKCMAIINLPVPIGNANDNYPTNRNPATFFLKLALPYADDSGTDFSITMCKKENCAGANGIENPDESNSSRENIAYFVGVQAQVDATGRANDIYRRIDARVELVETGFPYPEYAIWMAGTDQVDITKDFWVTNDCKVKLDSAADMKNCTSNTGEATSGTTQFSP